MNNSCAILRNCLPDNNQCIKTQRLNVFDYVFRRHLSLRLLFIVTLYSKDSLCWMYPESCPIGSIPRVFQSVKFRVLSGKTSVNRPLSQPLLQLCFLPQQIYNSTDNGIQPGQSPPPVNTPIFFMTYQYPFVAVSDVKDKPSLYLFQKADGDKEMVKGSKLPCVLNKDVIPLLDANFPHVFG